MAQGDNMSGRKISDHSFFAGGKGKNSVLPDGVHTKVETSAEGDGALKEYQDTTDKIKAQQEAAKSKMKKHVQPPAYRN
jgi:hypothetical protein